ncbi:MAG TPA: DUF192 domain-containing protein [Firmicutes bacterium]|nr:DUF192 domain-containing protein [Candidatus Fermentithermobacillaceae bacterium]
MFEQGTTKAMLNLDTGEIVVRRVYLADTFRRRLLGLILRSKIDEDEGLLLLPCKGVHTFFMRFPIDVIYLDRYMSVVALFPDTRPWRVLPQMPGVAQVLEMPAGTISKNKIKVGNTLAFTSLPLAFLP